MPHEPTLCCAAHVRTPSDQVTPIPREGRLVFGRDPETDLVIPGGRRLSRRAGVITAVPGGGVWVGNLSRTHPLYTDSDGYRVRLPPLKTGQDEPSGGWFVRAGTALVGSRAMLDAGRPLRLTVIDGYHDGPHGSMEATPLGPAGNDDDQTLLPLSLDPGTKVFLVALLWCQPWLIDPSRTTPLPRAPEIARTALQVTDAHHQLTRFDSDPAFRDRLSARIGEHLRTLRRKIAGRDLVRAGTRLSDEVIVEVLIEHAIIGHADLALLNDPSWRSRQENLWWNRPVP